MERAESLYFTRIGVFKGEYTLPKLGKLIRIVACARFKLRAQHTVILSL